MSVRLITRFVWTNPGNRNCRIRKLWGALAWQIHKRCTAKPEILKLANGVKFRAYPDCVISSALHYADWPEYHELQFCRRQLKLGDLLYDVGANVGHFSLLLGDVVGPEHVFCFEPTPVSWRRLKENFQLNGWPTKRLYHAAVGKAVGTISFPDLESPETTSSAAVARAGRSMVEVPLLSLDSLISEINNRKVGLLKIDVEGYEPEVFAGAEQFLAEVRPAVVMFESLQKGPHPDIRNLLKQTGYSLFQLDGSGRPESARLDAQNLFAVPETSIGSMTR